MQRKHFMLVAVVSSLLLLFCVGRVEATAPSISSLSPTSGPWGTPVTIHGNNFGNTQGTSTVKFAGTISAPTSWGNTVIVVPVPKGAVTGSVVVTVSGASSNGVTFTVLHGNLIIGSQVGSGGTYEEHDDTGALLQTGNLSITRSLHTATLLNNGTIFVAGGETDPTSWQIFSLVNGQIQITGSGLLQNSLYSHVATVLSNGNIFLGGGTIASGSWEIHSPTGALVGSGSFTGHRSGGATAVSLKNGNVWISGSNTGKGEDCTWEIHNVNGGLVSTGALNTCRSSARVFVLSNGDVLLLAGVDSPGDYDIYTQTGVFVRNGFLTNAFNQSASGVLVNNDVFVSDHGFWEFIGFDANGNQTFDTTGSLFDARDFAKSVVTTTGNILITGGADAPGTFEIWTPNGTHPILFKQGNLFDARDVGHSDTHF
jgi:hypothetical protein